MRVLQEFRFLISYIWSHPGNKTHRLAGVVRFIYWQLRKRFLKRPMVIPILVGGRFIMMPDSKFSSLVYYTHLPDWDEMNFLLRVLRPSDGFIDIGANVGFYTLVAAARCVPENIWAAEALPGNLAVLRDQLTLNGMEAVHVLPYALAAEHGDVHFAAQNRETGTISFRREANTVKVEARPLDELVKTESLPVRNIAKMDVEGCEVEVLQGASQLLASAVIGVWLFELSEQNLARRAHTKHDLLNQFEQHHYSFWEWSEGTMRLSQIDPLNSSKANFLAIHRDATWVRDRLQSIPVEA